MICPVCQARFQTVKVFSLATYCIYTCDNCLTRFSDPFVNNKDIYNDNFIEESKQYFYSNNCCFSGIYPQIKQFIDVKNKRILDIGCGVGSFLEIMKENNEVVGLELSQTYEKFLKTKNIPYKIGNLEVSLKSFPDSNFDLITFWDVFEHFENPTYIFKLVLNKLRPGGIIINWTNNYNDFITKFAEISYKVSFGHFKALIDRSFNQKSGHNYNFVEKSLETIYHKFPVKILKTIITDTPSERLTKTSLFKFMLDCFYVLNKATGKGKIICHVLEKQKHLGS